MISAYRSPGGSGIRLDGGTTHAGTAISAHFDSMLVKLTCRGRDFDTAVGRARRAVAEFRIRGVATNIPFLQAVLDDPDFRAGRRHHVVHRGAPAPADRAPLRRPRHAAAHLPRRRHGQQAARRRGPQLIDPRDEAAAPSTRRRAARRLQAEARRARARRASPRWLRESPTVGVTDTTFRDAHQSLLATRVRTKDLLAVAPVRGAHPAAAAVAGVLGRRHLRRRAALPRRGPVGAPGRAARGRAEHLPADAAARPQHRRLHAVPDRGDRRLRRRRPRPPASTSSGSSTRSTTSGRCGRPSTPCARPGRRSPRSRCATPPTCPTRPRSSTRWTTTSGWPSRSSDAGAHVLAVKDMAGLLRAPAATTPRLGAAQGVRPAGPPAHPRHRGRPARHLPRRDPGRRGRGRRRGGVHGGHHVAAVAVGDRRRHRPLRPAHRARPAGRRRPGAVLGERAQDLRAVRVGPRRRRPDASTTTRSPAGSCPTCAPRPSRSASATASRTIEAMYAAADRILGRLVKVTPSSKVVGDLALHLVGAGRVAGGLRGRPRTGSTSPTPSSASCAASWATRPAAGRSRSAPRRWRAAPRPSPIEELTAEDRDGLAKDRRATLNRLLFPGADEGVRGAPRGVRRHQRAGQQGLLLRAAPGEEYAVDLEPGVRLLIELEAVGEADERGMRTVMSTLNGQLRPIQVRDRSVASDIPADGEGRPGQPRATSRRRSPAWSRLAVAEGDEVEAGAHRGHHRGDEDGGRDHRAEGRHGARAWPSARIQQVEGGDLLVELA